MKKHYLLMLAAAASFTFVSCGDDDEKKDDPAPAAAPTKTDMLTAKSWKLTDRTQSANGATMNTFNNTPTCQKDDLFKFAKDNTLTFDAGTVKCSSADPQTETGRWIFLSNETKLRMIDAASDTSEFDLGELSATKLVTKETVTNSFPGMPTVSYVITSTYSAQ